MNISSTADQALRVLLALGEKPGSTPSDLARALDINRSAVHRLLATLEARSFVRRVEGRAAFSLGAAILDLARHTDPDIKTVAHPELVTLTDAISETSMLFVPDLSGPAPQAQVVDQVAGADHVIRVQFEVGLSVGIHLGAGGLTLLAYADDQTVEAASSAAGRGLSGQLARVRQSGYALTHDELLSGVVGIAVPILDGERAVGSISVAVPETRSADLETHVDRLRAAADRIAAGLHGPNPA